MDFSQQYQYGGGPSHHQPFMPVSPPIANASQSSSEEYNNDSSPVSTKISPLYITPPVTPPVMVPHRETKLYEPPAGDFLPTYRFGHNFQQQQGANFSGIVGSNSPMMPSSSAGKSSFMQHQQHPQASYDSSNASYQGHALALRGSLRGGPPSLDTDDQSVGLGDDMIMTKRKAQNRAAQRAFRERKEKHVKDLEATLNELRESQEKATTENEKLKKDLQKITTENLILRASKGSDDYSSAEVLVTGPSLQQLNNSAFASDTLPSLNSKVSHRVVEAPDGTRLLAAGAAWDYIVSHPQYQTGLVDISSVSDYLMKNPSYDGQGPVFSEKDIDDAIERSMTEGSDDLL